ncbi:MAG: hypothetical protein E6Q97_12060 [Desulfurellales bacterium]|nr:MAG: hypothetical protein E6Q97_12060 [Desulfurellales bacterium]
MPPRKRPTVDPEQQAIQQQQALLTLYQRDPTFWRERLIVDGPEGPIEWGKLLCPVQKADFAALDPALKYAARVIEYDDQGNQLPLQKPPYQRFWIQRSRGYSKSTDIASCIIWLIAFATRKIEGIIAAEDQEQAEFVREQMIELMQYNEWLNHFVKLQKHELINKHNGSVAAFKTSDAKSSFGAKPHFTLATEFTHWSKQDFWTAVFSSAAKTFDKGGLLLIDCNAGTGSGWQYRMREEARESPLWYYHAPPGYAPWYSEQTIQEQAAGLTIQEFLRLWKNEWQASDGEYVSLTEADACIDPELKELEEAPMPGCYVAVVDYAEKGDLTAAIVGHLYDGKIIVDRLDTLHPKLMDDGIVKVQWVEQWMRKVQEKFGGEFGSVQFVCDPHQLVGTIQILEAEGFNIERFEFAGGRGNFEASHVLRKMILHKAVNWYPGCGQIKDSAGRVWTPGGSRDDLSTELAALLYKKIGNRYRFTHARDAHDDRAFVLSVLCDFIVKNSTEVADWEHVLPAREGRFGL